MELQYWVNGSFKGSLTPNALFQLALENPEDNYTYSHGPNNLRSWAHENDLGFPDR